MRRARRGRGAVRRRHVRRRRGERPARRQGGISHAYETGASLYFTALAARDATDPIGQWQVAKAAASEAITGLGTISHHHAVGADHVPYLEAEIGALGVDVLASVKRTLDPTGVLNPGKLIPGKFNPAELASPGDR
nr:FAD-linked oxidase C-terminal domain-containing protein [Saccharothrix sp. ALI-22-I]